MFGTLNRNQQDGQCAHHREDGCLGVDAARLSPYAGTFLRVSDRTLPVVQIAQTTRREAHSRLPARLEEAETGRPER